MQIASIRDRLREDGYAAPFTATSASAAERLARFHVLPAASAGGTVIKNPQFHDAWPLDLLRQLLHDVVVPVLGDSIWIENCFVVCKAPGSTFEVPTHQDGVNADLELDGDNSLSLWIALTLATPENGCLLVTPGSHLDGYRAIERSGERAHLSSEGSPIRVRDGATTLPERHVPLRSGEACVLHSAVLHRSGPNRTAEARVGVNYRLVNARGILRRSAALHPMLGV